MEVGAVTLRQKHAPGLCRARCGFCALYVQISWKVASALFGYETSRHVSLRGYPDKVRDKEYLRPGNLHK